MKIYEINENMSHTAKRIHDTERKKKIKPGTDEWFKLWFSLPYLKEGAEVVLEGYKLQLERGDDMDVLHIVDTKTGERTEVRGKPDYERAYDPEDTLHQLLDKIGKAANISELINGEPVGINPRHPDGDSAKTATDKAFNENDPGSLAHKINWGGQNKQPKPKQPKQSNQQQSWWQSLKQRVMGEADIDYYGRQGSEKPDYMYKGNPGIGSMTDDEVEALSNQFMQKYDQAMKDMDKEMDQDIWDGPAGKFVIDNGEVFDDLLSYQIDKLKKDPNWRQNIPSREYDTKYNVGDPREPRLQKPTVKDNPSIGYKFKRPHKEPV